MKLKAENRITDDIYGLKKLENCCKMLVAQTVGSFWCCVLQANRRR